MSDKRFDSPVFVKNGQFTIMEIASIGDALDFLDEWPIELQDAVYKATVQVCHSAYGGSDPINSAREAFTRWAKSANILEDVGPIPAWMAGPKSGGGGIQA